MLKRIADYIAKYQLLDIKKLHLVALSGGADSVCLLLILKQLGYNIHAVHCNFKLRGEESYRDEEFCVELCKRIGIELHIIHFDTKEYAELHKVSIELAARDLRYNYFEQLRKAIEAEDIVVAHHSDDNIETFIMNILRGTGIHGLAAIKPRNGRIIRPLLCVSRQDIEEFLSQQNQSYQTDRTNLEDEFTRNNIRLNLIPFLQNINPAAKENILKTISNVVEAEKIVDDATEKTMKIVTKEDNGCVVIDRSLLLKQASPEHILYTLLSGYGFLSQQIENIYNNIKAQPGRIWEAEKYIIATDRDALIIGEKSELSAFEKEIRIPECGIYIYNEHAKVSVETDLRTDDFQPSKEKLRVTLDAEKVRFPITIRTVQDGDRFKPFGMHGTKLVNDYLTDRKLNYFQRKKQLVAVDADNEIVWLIGLRTSQTAACSDGTIKILTMRYIINEE